MSNVTDLQAFIKRKAEEQEDAVEKLICMDQYSAHHTQLTLDLKTKISMSIDMLRSGWLNRQDTKAMDILKMAHIANDVLQGVYFPFNLFTGTSARHTNDESPELQYYVYGAGMARYDHSAKTGSPTALEFQVQLALWEIHPDDMTGNVRVDLRRVQCPVLPDALIRSQQLLQILANLNDIVRINGGTSVLRDEGKFLALLPHSPRYTLSVAVVGDLPFEYV